MQGTWQRNFGKRKRRKKNKRYSLKRKPKNRHNLKMCLSVPFQTLIFNDLITSGITGVLEINMFIATGFDNLSTHNPHIVCDKNYVYVL